MNKAIDKNYKSNYFNEQRNCSSSIIFGCNREKTHGAFLPEHYIQFGRIKKTTLREYLVASGFSKSNYNAYITQMMQNIGLKTLKL